MIIYPLIPYFIYSFYFSFFGCTEQLVGSQFPGQGVNPGPQPCKCRVLTTALPYNVTIFFKLLLLNSY